MSLPGDLRPWMQRATDAYEIWIDGRAFPRRDIQTPRGLLGFLNSAGGRLLEAGYFVGAALRQELLPGSLVLLIGAVFFLSRHSAEVELDITERLFPKGHLPEQWSGKRDAAGITISVAAFFALYMVLAWVSGQIRVVSFIMLVIACIDFNTRRLIGKKIKAYFRDDQYAPRADDEDCELIENRRRVIRGFLYDKPHLLKEAARVAGCALAFGIAAGGHWFGQAWAAPMAYLFLMTTLLANEIVTWQWRADRDRRLNCIEGLQTRTLVPFSLQTWIVSVVSVVICAVVSWMEGTLTAPYVTIGFLNHGGMLGDLIIMPLINGMIAPRFPRLTARRALLLGALFVCALMLAIIAHQQWALIGRTAGITDHVFPRHGPDIWYHDLSVAGYLHVIYMSLELTLLLAYASVHMPRSTVVLVTGLLTIHVVVGQVQPAWYVTRAFPTARTMVPTMASVLVVWMVAFFKTRHGTSH